jgi:hypothetical protein
MIWTVATLGISQRGISGRNYREQPPGFHDGTDRVGSITVTYDPGHPQVAIRGKPARIRATGADCPPGLTRADMDISPMACCYPWIIRGYPGANSVKIRRDYFRGSEAARAKH